MASPSCFRVFWHWVRLAASRTFCTAGRSKATSTPMMAMTTRSSIRVKPRVRSRRGERDMEGLFLKRAQRKGKPQGRGHLRRHRAEGNGQPREGHESCEGRQLSHELITDS